MGLESALLAKIAIGSTVANVGLGIMQNREARKQSRAQQAIQNMQARRQQIQQLRQQQVAQARLAARSEQGGTLDSSGFSGGSSSIGATTAGNIGFAQQITSIQNIIASSQRRSANIGLARGIAQGIGQAALSAYNPTGGSSDGKVGSNPNQIKPDLQAGYQTTAGYDAMRGWT